MATGHEQVQPSWLWIPNGTEEDYRKAWELIDSYSPSTYKGYMLFAPQPYQNSTNEDDSENKNHKG